MATTIVTDYTQRDPDDGYFTDRVGTIAHIQDWYARAQGDADRASDPVDVVAYQNAADAYRDVLRLLTVPGPSTRGALSTAILALNTLIEPSATPPGALGDDDDLVETIRVLAALRDREV